MTNGNSFIELNTIHNCMKPIWRIGNPEDICYIKMLNDVIAGKLVVPTEDMKKLLDDCSNYVRPCAKS